MKQLKTLTGKTLLATLTTFFVISCGDVPVRFEPNIYVGDYVNQQLTNSEGVTVKCDQPQFNTFVSFTREQASELANILANAKVPRNFQAKRTETVDAIWTAVWKSKHAKR